MVVARVILLLLLAAVVTRASANVKAYRYIEESLGSVGKGGWGNFIEMANMNYFRMLYPQVFGVSRWPDFFAQQRAKDEGLSEKKAIEQYRLALFSDQLSGTKLSDALMQDDVYRAHVFAYAILYSTQPDKERNHNEMLAIANASQTVVPLVMAIDADYSLVELLTRTLQVLQHGFNFSTHQAASELSNSNKLFTHTGNYLMRSNKAEPDDAASFQATQLIRLGFHPTEVEALSYRARDAIIISNPDSKDDFVNQANALLKTDNFDPEAINAAVADIGPLVFMLTSQYGYELDEIGKHDIDELVKIFNFR